MPSIFFQDFETLCTILEVGSCERGRICPTRFDVVTTLNKIIVNLLEAEFCQLKGEFQAAAETDGADQQSEYMMESGIILGFSPEVDRMMLDQGLVKFSHIISNLVRNALQHKNSRVDIHVAVQRSNLQVRVSDDGDGIAPEDRCELFTFYTRIKPYSNKAWAIGHGIGLAGSRILARRIGGDITVDTHFKTGISFLIQLPMKFYG